MLPKQTNLPITTIDQNFIEQNIGVVWYGVARGENSKKGHCFCNELNVFCTKLYAFYI